MQCKQHANTPNMEIGYLGQIRKPSLPLVQRSGALPKPPDPSFTMLKENDPNQEPNNQVKDIIKDLVSQVKESPSLEKVT